MAVISPPAEIPAAPPVSQSSDTSSSSYNAPLPTGADIRMPGMRGDDFLEWIKQNELFRHIPVIMLSSEDSTNERIRLLEIGAVDYIVKPFNPMELKIRVKKILP